VAVKIVGERYPVFMIDPTGMADMYCVSGADPESVSKAERNGEHTRRNMVLQLSNIEVDARLSIFHA
jgi:hypothetical protein